jgi:polyribonucleotide nucleotidyltransferase
MESRGFNLKLKNKSEALQIKSLEFHHNDLKNIIKNHHEYFKKVNNYIYDEEEYESYSEPMISKDTSKTYSYKEKIDLLTKNNFDLTIETIMSDDKLSKTEREEAINELFEMTTNIVNTDLNSRIIILKAA